MATSSKQRDLEDVEAELERLYAVFAALLCSRRGRVMRDPFRPSRQPARLIYDAFQEEARKRHGRSLDQWQGAERHAVWSAARDWAQQNGKRAPLLAQVERAESQAMGHVDYGAKLAYAVERFITGDSNE